MGDDWPFDSIAGVPASLKASGLHSLGVRSPESVSGGVVVRAGVMLVDFIHGARCRGEDPAGRSCPVAGLVRRFEGPIATHSRAALVSHRADRGLAPRWASGLGAP